MKLKSTLFLLSTTFISIFSFSQTIQENDYTLNYVDNKVQINFNKGVSLKAFDNKSQMQKRIAQVSNSNSFVLDSLQPAQIIKLEYSLNDGTTKTNYIAAKSASTGTINVYFNHTVDNSKAQYQNAVNLADTLDDKLIDYINACQSTLDIAIYNSYSPSSTSGIAGAINNAYARGVQVRVVYDGSTSSAMIPLLNPGINTLPSPTSSSYGIMHNKFVIFDADSSDPNIPWLWTGSTNWTAVQIDGPDRNNVIAIQDQALAQAYKIEFEEMWGSNTLTPNTTVSKFGPYKTDNTPHSFVIGGRVVNSYFSPSDGVTAKIVNVINSANTDIEIADMLITRDDIRDALINKYNTGITAINAVFDSQNPSGNDFTALQTAIGTTKVVKYTGAGILHHKFMLVDNFNAASDPQVLTGSHNWSSSAETKNDENTLIVHDKNVANQYFQAFAYLYNFAGGVLNASDFAISNNEILLYPNPTDGIAFFKANPMLNNAYGNYTIYNVIGTKIAEKQFRNLGNTQIDLTAYPKGLYFINLTVAGKVYQAKIIKK
ncbi:phospholipase D-like domain-containing protein [Cloacibacterium sp.]|uniref:phospholipase D-like domain-containing protein n=1 Tax=Cloacibacterium sp. TaxID=1913682 RepID=UPI0039E2456E